MPDINLVISFDGFNEGLSPLAHIDNSSFIGNKGQAADMLADVISNPGFLNQSPGLQDLTNGTQVGVVNELIRFILDEPTESNETYAIGTSKAFKINPTNVVSGGTPNWPQVIPNMVSGESVVRLKENVFFTYNTLTAGDIAVMPIATQIIDPDWGSTTDQALEKAPHPTAVKEDIFLFGNGRYVGCYIVGTGTLNVQKLDFGEGNQVADIVFSANMWWIAVNSVHGKQSRVYLYDGSALSNILADESGIGDQEIGFLYVYNGVIYLAYNDKSANGFSIGWIAGRQIKPLRYFKGTLPDHRQKALYKNTILFASGEKVFSFGASVDSLPLQISPLLDGGYSTVGAVASPFGTPMIASENGSGGYRLAKFGGYSTNSFWKSILVDTTSNRYFGNIDTVIVMTKPLPVGAKCKLNLEGDHGTQVSNDLVIQDEGKIWHIFKQISLKACSDVRLTADFSVGSTVNTCDIRKIILLGTFVDR